ncbi:MAG: ATP synthase F1 subunit delta [Candidatus Rokubacteria bacterium]|nr:ATP synthase F1 subunit delta [Candidatus Rokubacteria bacterium]
MKAPPPPAKPYARAIYELAKERGQTDVIGRELGAIAGLLRGDPALRDFFVRPWISAAKKRDVAAELGAKLELSNVTRDFLGLVAQKGRAEYLEAIADAFRSLADVDLNRVRAYVRTAVALSEAERTALADKLGRALGGKTVLVEDTVDPNLLGGFVAEIGSFIVDGTLDGQLERLRERLVRA